MHPVEDYVSNDIDYAIDIYDPWEKMNRSIYRFNTQFDRYVFLPVVDLYQFVTPDFVEERISNFFSNIGEITNFTNAALQLDLEASVNTLVRFMLNSTIGLFGFNDVATEAGLPEHDEDLGQTLAHYGVGDGPYLVLPLFGPSNLRDAMGLLGDTAVFVGIDPLNLDDHSNREKAYFSMNAVNKRSEVDFRYYQTGSPFEYEMVRLLYTKWREIEAQK